MSTHLPYLERIRAYYQTLGYGAPYRFAQFDDVPFQSFDQPLSKARIGIVTTAAPFQPGKGDQGPGAAYNGAAKFFEIYTGATDRDPDLCISHIAIDRDHTTAKDQGSYFPLQAFQSLLGEGKIGSVSPRFYGLPTNRSQNTTINTDCVRLVELCIEDSVDIAVLVPNCPVCHQSTALAARALEEAGIASVVLGCARDIVEHVGVPRLLFNDFPLGNAAGLPHDSGSQKHIAQLALELVTTAKAPRTTLQSPYQWPGPESWKNDYSNADRLSDEEIAQRRREFEQAKRDAPPKKQPQQ